MKLLFFEKRFKLLIVSFLFSSICFSQIRTGTYDPFDYGAKGDGETLDTKAIQLAVDNCYKAGGGKIYLHNGRFLSGTIYLKSNVSFHVEAGAILLGSDNPDNFPITASKYASYKGKFVTNKMLIYAEDAQNITISGRGIINGQGDKIDGPYLSPSFSGRPRIIHLRGCTNVKIEDITLQNSASWVQLYQSCKNIIIDGITVDSRPNKDIEKPRFDHIRGRNNDGLDLVDCQQVRISNCYINSGDDAICLKSFSPDEACRDITISNCVISSNASGIKIGTETSGTFEDISIQNCAVYDTRIDAVSIMTVDGAKIERITISGITARNIKGAAIFIGLGKRNRTYRKNAEINKPCLKDIIIENIQGTGISSEYGCSVSGIQDLPIENIIFRNINLEFEGGGKIEESYCQIPENETGYPNGLMFGVLPAYGFFIRHAKNISLENIRLSCAQEDQRPAILCNNVEQIEINRLKAHGTAKTPELIRLINSRDILISESRANSPIPVFLSIYGNKSENISMLNNFLKNVKQKFAFGKECRKSVIKEFGTM